MLASQICQGVGKSGSPTPREITPSMLTARSKNLRIPDGGMAFALADRKFLMVFPQKE
jgi:hypothetical protein